MACQEAESFSLHRALLVLGAVGGFYAQGTFGSTLQKQAFTPEE